MRDRCRDDWVFFLLIIALFTDTFRRPRDCTRDATEFDLSDEGEHPAVEQPRWRSRSVLWWTAATAALIGVTLLWPMSPEFDAPAPVVSNVAPPSPEEVKTSVAAHIVPAEASSVELLFPPAVEGLPEPLLIGEPEALPLPATATVMSAAIPLVASSEPGRKPFGLGSTRDEVIAAQGSTPTYVSKNGRTLWWGSARVLFDRNGRVEGWRLGVPGLSVRP